MGQLKSVEVEKAYITVYVYYFLSFYLTSFKYHIALAFKRGDQLDKVWKVQMRKCAWDKPALLCCLARLGPGPALKAFPAHLLESDTHALCRGQRSVTPSWVFPFCFFKETIFLLTSQFWASVVCFTWPVFFIRFSIRPHSGRQCCVYEECLPVAWHLRGASYIFAGKKNDMNESKRWMFIQVHE